MIITKPVKVTWRAYLDEISSPYEIVKSEKLRKNLKKLNDQLPQLGLRVEIQKDLSEDVFLKWLAIYNKVIGSKKEGRIKIDQSWLANKIKGGKSVYGVLLYDDNGLIGGNLGTLTNEKMTVGYGALLPFDTKHNLGAFIDFKCIEAGFNWGYKVVSFGQDTNLYGGHLSVGLLSHKARLGLTIEEKADKGFEQLETQELRLRTDTIMFLGKGKILYIIYKNEKPQGVEFMAKGIERVEYLNNE